MRRGHAGGVWGSADAQVRARTARPDFLLAPLFRVVFNRTIMDRSGARHVRNARGEMAQLSADLLALADEAGVDTPVLRELHRYAACPIGTG